ncbi:hypothetical protein GOL96_24925 [Sinorhizobium medicae]|uniref:Bacteriophage tail tape measure N-terminal domain-containing protein n=3 Tax=Sinorhizobium medicae TaxID=110321 RepID=A0ABX4TQX2_9HYPH|nr:phage tail length tape measure family protein [Sinorhizobium medicae]MDX0598877.1 hypothetical protein [Sinorhizobium medicae]MDX0695059.1 hypothetical protein [Sinorhizobium medicae]MDX0744846.1 hypothetical protein [Sinorhizobium medicae]MDX0801718.1 hypothetical protein [Sinorhizobium medicae]MDX1194621.1 hypothetical protein [Sinorhizobium medicae]
MAATEDTRLILAISADIAALKRAMKDADITVKKTTDAVNDNFNKVGSSADNAARQISRSMRSSAGDVRNLQYQINDIATGLASGQSPFTIMAQQSGQLSQALSGAGGLRGALALVGSAVGGLINPVNLVLAGLAAATLALQAYFDDADSDADAANKALEEHAKLLAEIKERWGATIPEVAEYIGEIERATESLKKQQDLKAIVTDIFKPASEAVAATENSVLDLQSRLSAIGKQDLGGQIARSFAKVKTEVAANRYPLQEMVNLQNLVLQAIALQVTGAKDLADAINRQIVPALRNANTEASEMTRSFGGLPRSLGGAGPPTPGLGIAIRHTETERLEEAMGDAADAIDSFVERVIQAEAPRGGPNLAGASSAHGYGQFIKGTWLEVFRRHFAAEAEGMSDAAILALRDDLETNRRMIRAYATDNAEALARAGETVNEASLQLAHFLGAGGALKVLKAPRGTRIADIPGMEDAIAANPSVLGGGARREDVLAYAANRASGGSSRIKQESKDLDEWLAKSRQAIELRQKEALIDKDITATVSQKAAAKEEERLYQEGLNAAIRQYGTVSDEQREKIRATAHEMAQLGLAADQMKEAQNRATETAERNKEAYQQLANQISQTAKTAFSGFVNDLRNGVSAGEAFRNMLDRVVDGMINMAIEAMFAKNALGGVISQLLGGGGFPAAPVSALVRHSGGDVGSTAPRRRVSPAIFAGAPRLHGGLMPDEFPAILQKGEIVLPRTARRGGAGMPMAASNVDIGNITVNVPSGVAATTKQGAALGQEIDKAVQAVIVRESRPGGLLRRTP